MGFLKGNSYDGFAGIYVLEHLAENRKNIPVVIYSDKVFVIEDIIKEIKNIEHPNLFSVIKEIEYSKNPNSFIWEITFNHPLRIQDATRVFILPDTVIEILRDAAAPTVSSIIGSLVQVRNQL